MKRGGLEVDARALEVREPGVVRSRVQSFQNHRAVCKTVENRSSTVKTKDEEGNETVSIITTATVTNGCLIGKYCEKGYRLRAEIDNPPAQVNNPPGTWAAKRAQQKHLLTGRKAERFQLAPRAKFEVKG